ncbi:hypothetical protein WP50_35445, partial [Lactiplantibacillus plantarum]
IPGSSGQPRPASSVPSASHSAASTAASEASGGSTANSAARTAPEPGVMSSGRHESFDPW